MHKLPLQNFPGPKLGALRIPGGLVHSLKGFTLIELLVVIAIIALLAAILFPVFGRARENARRSTCQSNMKQVTTGLFMYAYDNDGRFPVFRGETYPDHGPFWHTVTHPYVKSESLYRCPSVGARTAAISSFESNTYPTYGLIGRDPNGNTQYIYSRKGFPLTVAKEPTRTFMMVETLDTLANLNNPTRRYGWILAILGDKAANISLATIDGPQANLRTSAHFDGYNVAFLDGHVKYMKYGAEADWIVAIKNQ